MTVMPGVGWPSATAETFLERWFVGMNESPILPVLEVYAVSHNVMGMHPSITPFLSCCLVSGLLRGLVPWMGSHTVSFSLVRLNGR